MVRERKTKLKKQILPHVRHLTNVPSINVAVERFSILIDTKFRFFGVAKKLGGTPNPQKLFAFCHSI